MSPVIYSFVVNGSHMGAECLVCLLIIKSLPVRRLLNMGQER
ncbi:MAG: energy-coupled thiamine transporter ThiT [Selenomonadaceae bacterium]|nr:energy-coupled thiamine transporter ThiT [Selenomonadaceae bacterium]